VGKVIVSMVVGVDGVIARWAARSTEVLPLLGTSERLSASRLVTKEERHATEVSAAVPAGVPT
jgi:hypothetical protein